MQLTTLKTRHETTNKLFCFTEDGAAYVVKCYTGPDASRRYEREKEVMSHWTTAGFFVPQRFDRIIPQIPQPYLVMSRMEGMSLHEYLLQTAPSSDDKLDTLGRLFGDMSARHKLAVAQNDPCLIHYDLNSRNVICAGDKLGYLDFESKPRYGSVNEAAGAELLVLCKWAVRDIGRKYLQKVMQMVAHAYKDQKTLMEIMIDRTAGRPFQFYHRLRNRKYRKQHPDHITKYDIVDALLATITQ